MIRRLFSSQLRINVASGFGAAVINLVVLAVSYPMYLHFLGYERYGVWLVLATVLSFAQLGNLGIGQAVMKLVAEEHGRGNIDGVQRYVTTALMMLSVSGIIVLSFILAFKTQIIDLFKLNAENRVVAAWLLPYIGVLSLYVLGIQALNATLSGLGRMDLANYILSTGKIVAVIVAGLLLCSGLGIESLLIGSVLSYVFIQVASLICIRRIGAIRLLRLANLDIQRGKHLLNFGVTVFGGSLINMFLSPFNKMMLARYVGVATIPVYEIAYNGSMQIRALFEVGLRAIMPEISRIGGEMTTHGKERILQLYRRAMKVIFSFGIAIYGTLAISAAVLFRVWLGNRFVETIPGAFRVMLIGAFLSLLGVPAYYTLMGAGHVRYNLEAYIIQAAVNVVIIVGFVIASTVSIDTIVWSSSIAMAVATLFLIVQKRRTLQQIG